MPAKPPANLDHVWRTPGLSAAAAEIRHASNLASLKRKITYCIRRPSEPLQYQSVEGWSARQVLAAMQELGLSAARIQRSFGVSAR